MVNGLFALWRMARARTDERERRAEMTIRKSIESLGDELNGMADDLEDQLVGARQSSLNQVLPQLEDMLSKQRQALTGELGWIDHLQGELESAETARNRYMHEIQVLEDSVRSLLEPKGLADLREDDLAESEDDVAIDFYISPATLASQQEEQPL